MTVFGQIQPSVGRINRQPTPSSSGGLGLTRQWSANGHGKQAPLWPSGDHDGCWLAESGPLGSRAGARPAHPPTLRSGRRRGPVLRREGRLLPVWAASSCRAPRQTPLSPMLEARAGVVGRRGHTLGWPWRACGRAPMAGYGDEHLPSLAVSLGQRGLSYWPGARWATTV